jgi:hypothetical protein
LPELRLSGLHFVPVFLVLEQLRLMPPSNILSSTDSLARRVAGYATNLLATGLVLLAGLVFGSQIVAWWRTDQQQLPAVDHMTGVVGSELPISAGWMQFGDSTLAVHCTSFSGDDNAAFAQLKHRCRQAAKSKPLFRHGPSAAEQQLLQRLAGKTPIERLPGQWRIYQLTEGAPMVVVVGESADSASQVAVTDFRVISLGIAFPRPGQDSAADEWTLMVCAEAAQTSSDLQIQQPTAPPGAQRILAVRDDDGTELCSWNGSGNAEQWRGAFDQWHLSHGWSPIAPWVQLEQNWHRRYEHASRKKRFADVQFSATPDGSLSGFWIAGQ